MGSSPESIFEVRNRFLDSERFKSDSFGRGSGKDGRASNILCTSFRGPVGTGEVEHVLHLSFNKVFMGKENSSRMDFAQETRKTGRTYLSL